MSWKNKRLSLTEDQRARGVIFSSELIVTNNPDLKRVRHEVMADDPDFESTIERLKDTKFFENMARDMGWNVIHEIRR